MTDTAAEAAASPALAFSDGAVTVTIEPHLLGTDVPVDAADCLVAACWPSASAAGWVRGDSATDAINDTRFATVVCSGALPAVGHGAVRWALTDALSVTAEPRPLVAAGTDMATPISIPAGALLCLHVAASSESQAPLKCVASSVTIALVRDTERLTLAEMLTRLRRMESAQARLRTLVRQAEAAVFHEYWPASAATPIVALASPVAVRHAVQRAMRLPAVPLFHAHARLTTNAAEWRPSSHPPTAQSASSPAPCHHQLIDAVRVRAVLPPPYHKLTVSPHETLAASLPSAREIQPAPEVVRAVVTGPYAYFHYQCDGFDDRGYGCAYRSMQTVLSWFLLGGMGPRFTIPSVRGIQELLTKIDPTVHKPSFVGSKKWIGSIEVQLVAQHFLSLDLECRILRAESGTEFADNPSLIQQVVEHFRRGGGPGTIGGASMAFTLLGVHANPLTLEVEYLILDPHYPCNGDTDLGTVVAKRWLAWQDPRKFFAAGRDFNVCLPLPQSIM